MPERRADIDMAKGLAILLVVFGHIVARQDPQNVQWYEPLRRAVYSFHMPFFLYLSGLVAASSGFLFRGRAGFPGAVRARARRLLVPFFAVGLVVLAGKLTAARFIFVDHAPANIAAGLDGLFWHTGNSPALSIWYLFVLFVLSLATLWLLNGKAERLAWLVAMSLLLYPFNLPTYAYADRVFTYAPFFLLGAMAGFAGPRWDRILDACWPYALMLFTAGLICVALRGQSESQKAVMLPLGMLSMPALHGAMRHIGNAKWRTGLLFFGRCSFAIYLGNTICIGLAKGIMLRFIPWDGENFLLFAPALALAGTFGPIAVKRYGFKLSATVKRLAAQPHFEKYPP